MSHKLIDKLSDLSDITGTPADGQVLTYQSASSDWKASTASGGSNPRTILIRPTQATSTYFYLQKIFTNSTLIPLDEIGLNPVAGAANVNTFPKGLYRLYLAWRFLGGTGLTYDICFQNNYNQVKTSGSQTGMHPVWSVSQMASTSIRNGSMPSRTAEHRAIINHNVDWEQYMYVVESSTMNAMGSTWYSGWYCEVERLGDYDPNLTNITGSTLL